jgi:lysophospholipase L1-like esterase
MRGRRAAGRLALVVLLAASVAGVRDVHGPGHGGDTRTEQIRLTAASAHTVLALGDSVPSGHACDCQPFPLLYGDLLSRRVGAAVTVDNRAVSGLDTAGVLAQLRTSSVERAAAASDIVLLTIGANDFGDHHDEVVEGQCGSSDTDCVSDEMESMGRNLARTLARLRALRQGAPTTVLVTGYWNVFEDGDVARNAYGKAGLRASLRLTRQVNRVIHATTRSAGDTYVNLFRPFERSGRDVTALMAPDGDHPNARGHRLIARVLLRAGLPAQAPAAG